MGATTELAAHPLANAGDAGSPDALAAPLATEIQRRLTSYLDAPAARCAVLASGWETTVFEVVLAARSPRLGELPVDRPLVLRFYQGSRADDKGAREAVTMRLLAENGYPIPRPYLYEPDHEPLGAPFLMMERVSGGPLFLTSSFPRAFKTFLFGFVAFVRAQAELHKSVAKRPAIVEKIPQAYVDPTAASSAPLLNRLLAIIAERVERGPLPGLRDALASVRELAGRFSPGPQTLVHMDYHPQNVLVRGFRVSGIIDWVNADRGDRHLCAATTAVILSTSAMERPRWMRDNAAGNTLRTLFATTYMPLYHALAPMEFERFRFAQAVAALLRLSMFGMMRARGPESVGFRPEAIENVTPMVVRLLTRYASRKCGVPVSLDNAA